MFCEIEDWVLGGVQFAVLVQAVLGDGAGGRGHAVRGASAAEGAGACLQDRKRCFGLLCEALVGACRRRCGGGSGDGARFQDHP